MTTLAPAPRERPRDAEADAGGGAGDDGGLAGDVHVQESFLFRRIDLVHQRQAFHREPVAKQIEQHRPRVVQQGRASLARPAYAHPRRSQAASRKYNARMQIQGDDRPVTMTGIRRRLRRRTARLSHAPPRRSLVTGT